MEMNYKKMMFMTIMMISTMMTISSNNWIGMWMGMEMNLMSFIPFISSKKNKKSSKAMMMYFLVQSIGSMILLFSILMNTFIVMSPITMNEMISAMLTTGLLIKLGAAPFHMWLPEMMSNMNWMELLILMTWQKLAPLFTLSCMNFNTWAFKMSIVMSAAAGAIGGLGMTSIRKLMSYSSINHLSWMLLMMMMKTHWSLYLLMYSTMTLAACLFFNNFNLYFINQINNSLTTMTEKYSYATIMLSMGGLPPFLGFLPKWMTIDSMIKSNMIMIMMFMIMMSLLTLFYYMRTITPLLIMYTTSAKWNTSINSNSIYPIIFLNLMLPVCTMISFF